MRWPCKPKPLKREAQRNKAQKNTAKRIQQFGSKKEA
jgi:hypothetical protein